MKKLTILTLLMLLITGNGFCDSIPKEMRLTSMTAIAMSISRNIDLRIEAYNSEMAKKDLAKSWGIYNPVLILTGSGGVTAVPGDPFFSTKSATTSIGLTQNFLTGGSITASTQSGFFSYNPGTSAKEWQSTAGISITQPLLKNFGKETTQLSITLGASSLQDSLERFRASATETVASVLIAYNHLYVLQKNMETREASLNSARKLLDEINKRAPQGAVQGMEKANAEFAIAQRLKDVVEASRNVSDQEVNLRYLIGMESKTKIIPVDPPSKEEPQQSEEQAVKAALELRTDLKQLQISLKSSQLQERVAKKLSLPDLSLNATGGFTGTGGNVGESYSVLGNHPGTYWTTGMQLNIPLGNTNLKNEYLKSKIKTEQIEDQARALKWKIQNDVEADMRALISARLQMHLADRSAELSMQRLEAYRKNNTLGTASIQDVINAENDQNSANNAQLEAIETFANSVTKLWKDTGLLLDHYNVLIDATVPDKITGREKPGAPGANLFEPEGKVAGITEGSLQPQTPPAAERPTPRPGAGSIAIPAGAPDIAGVATDKKIAPEAVGPSSIPVAGAAEKLQIKAANPEAGSRIKNAPPAKVAEREGITTVATKVPVALKMGETGISGKVASSAASGTYTLVIGAYFEKSQLNDAVEKIKRTGLTPTVKEGPKKITSMLRLYIAEFTDNESAVKELDKLRGITPEGFILKNKERKYAVYASSHHEMKYALQEQARLSRHGIHARINKVPVSMPTFLLTVGDFPTKGAALENAAKLESRHLKAVVIENIHQNVGQ